MRSQRIHWLQHVPFEGLGYFASLCDAMAIELSVTRLYENEVCPLVADFDLLIVMGGPMNIDDHLTYPWLIHEKVFIRQVIDANKAVLGICLGAQLIASVLGAKVTPNDQKEIGWWPVQTEPKLSNELNSIFPSTFVPFHWHGDTFELAEHCIKLQSSQACANQSFLFKDNVIGLQYHIEMMPDAIESLCLHCADELIEAPFIQLSEAMMSYDDGQTRIIAFNLLQYLLKTV